MGLFKFFVFMAFISIRIFASDDCSNILRTWPHSEFRSNAFQSSQNQPAPVPPVPDSLLKNFVDLMIRAARQYQTEGRFLSSGLSQDGRQRFIQMKTEKATSADVLEKYYRVTVGEDGLLYGPDKKPYDTSTGVAWTPNNPQPTAIYVMNESGDFYSSTYRMHLLFHHASFFGGGPAAGSGEWKVIDGRFQMISNQSGHYEQDIYFLAQTVFNLYRQGVNLDGVTLGFVKSHGIVEATLRERDLVPLRGFLQPK